MEYTCTRRPSTSIARSFLHPGWGSNVMLQLPLQDVYIHLWIDNTAAVAYVNRMGGLHSFQEPVSTSITGLGLVSLQEPYNFSRAPFGLTEPIGRQGIENRLRFFRMGIGHPDLPQTDGDEGAVYCGSLCIPFFSQTSNILQLENGSRSESSIALIQSWNNIRGYAYLHFCLTVLGTVDR